MTIFFRPFCGALFYVRLAYVFQKLFLGAVRRPAGAFFFAQTLEKMNKFLFNFYMVFAYVFRKRFFWAVRRPAGAFCLAKTLS